jgi:tetratricopeptide (TPR) repeat protein
VELEPTNWRHFFRLGHASWGDERLSAAASTLALYPDFAFAHFQIAMVYVARGDLREAEIVLRQGAAVQDRQVARGDRYPALGLHWLLGLVRLAQADIDEAIQEFSREETLADANRLYGREYEMSAVHGRGACLMRLGLHAEAVTCFERALELYPDHAQSHLGVAAALRATGSPGRALQASERLPAIVKTLAQTRPIEAALVESQILADGGQSAAASALLRKCLASAPPGFAGWTIPVEPCLLQLSGTKAFTEVLQALAERAG